MCCEEITSAYFFSKKPLKYCDYSIEGFGFKKNAVSYLLTFFSSSNSD